MEREACLPERCQDRCVQLGVSTRTIKGKRRSNKHTIDTYRPMKRKSLQSHSGSSNADQLRFRLSSSRQPAMCLVSWHASTRPPCIEELVTTHSGPQQSEYRVNHRERCGVYRVQESIKTATNAFNDVIFGSFQQSFSEHLRSLTHVKQSHCDLISSSYSHPLQHVISSRQDECRARVWACEDSSATGQDHRHHGRQQR